MTNYNYLMTSFYNRKGITLIETIVGVVIMGIIMFTIYRGYSALLDVFFTSRLKILANAVANEQFETIRNMPYANVGTVGGVPSGLLPATTTKIAQGIVFNIALTIRNIDDPFDGVVGGAPNDTAPADYKLVEIGVNCASCGDSETFTVTGRVAPKNLESAGNQGNLFVQAIDANGRPLAGASVNIVNSALNPPINITDYTGADGFLRIVGTAPSVQNYHIVATKNSYSTDSTYAASAQNPNPIKPDATVALQTVTQATFAIDRVSNISASSLTESCSAVANTTLTLTGAKLIGTVPNVPKFSQNFSLGVSGNLNIQNLEWDSYGGIVANADYDLRGTIPNLPISLAPNANQNFYIVMAPRNPSALLVTVKDSATQLPIAGASVAISAGNYQNTLITGRGVWAQTDWSGGSGQDLYVNAGQYFEQDGNVETTSPTGDTKLKHDGPSTYPASGLLTSSTFDTGSASNFYNITWNPQSQPPETGADSLKFQIATATTTSPASWDYLGPDGTSNTFYTTSNGNINGLHNDDRYMRYKAYFSTASSTLTPTLSDIAITFASQCVPLGQVLFSGLANSTYIVDVQKTGYQNYSGQFTVNLPWQENVILMSP